MMSPSLPDWVELLLFLGYDGVLQTPALWDFRDFEYLPEFEQVLRDFPHVGVFISSTHREGASLSQLRMLYSPAVQHRILGGTPDLIEGRTDGGRYAEVQACLQAVGWASEDWIAMDDDAWLYPKDCPQLILTSKYGGFDE